MVGWRHASSRRRKKKGSLNDLKVKELLGTLDLREVEEVVILGLLAALLMGQKHIVQSARAAGADVPSAKPLTLPSTPEALERVRADLDMPMQTLETLAVQARERGATVTKDLVQQLRDHIQNEAKSAAASGTTLKDFAKKAQGMIKRAGLDPANPFKLETIFRTNLNTYYTNGRWIQIQQMKDTFPYIQYNAILDGATRPNHATMNGRVYPADHDIWDIWLPPNGFNCRCSITPVSDADVTAEKLSISKELPLSEGNPVLPDKGFRNARAKDL
jgi:SPP1 gp7 family putative phage head morphogenesis protein